jgi:mannose-6-phosphate isomerase class I
MTNSSKVVEKALEQGKGIFRLFPNWVPRSFCIPGKRLKLHPDDYYAFGAHRGGIDERWFASTTKADNGPETLPDEGLSYIYFKDGRKEEKVLLKEAIDIMGNDILGTDVMKKYGGWLMFSKFFDNMEPLPHHLHHDDEAAANVGAMGKPESYYFPAQLNNHGGWFPYTFFGLNPGTTKDDIRKCLENWNKGDNGILYLSRAYKLKPGTGWDVPPPGVLHAPGSLLTYEPQRSSDVFAMFQSLVWDVPTPWELLTKNVPEEHKNDLDYIVSLINWDLNVDPDFYQNRFAEPKLVKPVEEMKSEGYEEYWISYKSSDFSAKELRVFPGKTVTIKDEGAYGLITIEGHGQFGSLSIDAPSLIRFGEMTSDELFVTQKAAREGITITNQSENGMLVILKHFGPEL